MDLYDPYGHEPAVDRGIEWLGDRHLLIYLDILDMSHPGRCILGQLYGNYWDAVCNHQDGLTMRLAAELGFHSVAYNYEARRTLTEIWYLKLAAMR